MHARITRQSYNGQDLDFQRKKHVLWGYFYLTLAIIAEVVATSTLNASDGFRKPEFASVSLACYFIAYFFLGKSLEEGVRIAIAYGIWSGVGMVLISIIGIVWFGQRLDIFAIVGLALIVAGVVVINFSESVSGLR